MTQAESVPPAQTESEEHDQSHTASIQNNYTTHHPEADDGVDENLQTATEQLSNSLRVKLQIGFAFLTFVLLGANDAAIGVLLPHWGSHYEVDKTMLSLVFLAGSIGYLVAALNSNYLSKKLGNVNFLGLGNLIFLVGLVGFCFQPPIYILLSVPFLLGFGAAILEAALNAHLANFPNKTALLNYLHAFYGVGALVSPFLASQLLAAELSWNLVYFGLGAISLALLMSIRGLFTRADKEQAATETACDQNNDSNTPQDSPLKYRFVWLFAFFLLFYAGAEISLGNWSYSFLTEYRHEETTVAGWLVSGYWLALTVGRVCIAPLSNRLGSKGTINFCLMGAIVGLLAFNATSLTLTNTFGLLLTGFCLGPILPTGFAFLSNVVPGHLLTGSISFIASLSSLGKAIFPLLAGNIAEGFGLGMFLPYIITLAIAMVACWIIVLSRSDGGHIPVVEAAME